MAAYLVNIEGDDAKLKVTLSWNSFELTYDEKNLLLSPDTPKLSMLESTGLRPAHKKYELQAHAGKTFRVDTIGNYPYSLPRLFINGTEVKYFPELPRWTNLITGATGSIAVVSICLIGGWPSAVVAGLAAYFGRSAIYTMEDTSKGIGVAAALLGLTIVVWLFSSFLGISQILGAVQ